MGVFMKKILTLYFLIAILMQYSVTNAVTILIWDPTDENYGHAAIQTKTYHMSLWPDGDAKRDYSIWENLRGVPGSLHLHQNWDFYWEGNRQPIQYYLEGISHSRIDEAYEKILEYNNITPDNATLDYANDLISKKKDAEIGLSKSKWILSGGNYLNKTFYKKPHSCTTFSLSLLVNSDDSVYEFLQNHEAGVRLQKNLAKKVGPGHCEDVRNFHSKIKRLVEGGHLRKEEALIFNCSIS